MAEKKAAEKKVAEKTTAAKKKTTTKKSVAKKSEVLLGIGWLLKEGKVKGLEGKVVLA